MIIAVACTPTENQQMNMIRKTLAILPLLALLAIITAPFTDVKIVSLFSKATTAFTDEPVSCHSHDPIFLTFKTCFTSTV